MKKITPPISNDFEQFAGYAEQMLLPVWVIDFVSSKVLHVNSASEISFPYIEAPEDLSAVLNPVIAKTITANLHIKPLIIDYCRLEKDKILLHFQISATKLDGNHALLQFLELPQENFGDEGFPYILYCNSNGSVQKIFHEDNKLISGKWAVYDLFAEGHTPIIHQAIRNVKTGKNSWIHDLHGSEQIGNGLYSLFLSKTENKTEGIMAVIVKSPRLFQSALVQERNRASMAEEINEILKLEIKEHQKTQAKLKAEEAYSSNIIDSSLNMVIALDKAFKITELNRTAERISGFSRKEVIGKDLSLILGSEEELKSAFKAVNSKGFFIGELLGKKKNGEQLTLLASISRLLSDKGETLGYTGSLRDVSELKFWRKKLETTEERYKDLFENATDLIQGIDVNGKILYVNRSWCKCLGYKKSETAKLCYFDLIKHSELLEFKKHFESVLKGRASHRKVWTLIAKNGDEILVESNDNLKTEDGKSHSMRSIMRDVTAATLAERKANEQTARIEAIFENGKILIWTVDSKTKLTSFNNEYAEAVFKLYGRYPKVDLDKKKPKEKFAEEVYHAFWEKKYGEVFKTGKSVFFQTKTVGQDGSIYFREIYLTPIRSDKDKSQITEVAGMGIDITDKKLAERKINEQSAKIRTIFNATNHMIWSLDTNYNITSFNEVFAKKIKERYKLKVKLGDSGAELALKLGLKRKGEWDSIFNRVMSGEKLQFEVEMADNSGQRHIEDIALSPIYDDEGEVVEIAGLSQTVTFKKAAERKLKEQAAKINAIFDSTAMLIWTVDKNLRIVSYNKVFADQHFKLLGKEVSIGSNFIETVKPHIKSESYKKLKNYFNAAFRGEKQQFEGMLNSHDGSTKWMESFFNPIYSEKNQIKEISCLSYEITDKKIIEEQMRESIREKEVLLQEVHHRVKNNLQVISSILNLQSSYVKDENSLSILRESQNRIKSMSFIHESLYQTRDFSHIEFSDYILSLSKNLIHSYSLELGKVHLKTEFDRTFLSLDQAIPCGLIANELISNSLKYAFTEKKTGEIFISIKDNKDNVEMVISDDGIGLPKDFNYEQSDSLGLQLVFTLAEQLDAKVEVDISKGTKYLITFIKE